MFGSDIENPRGWVYGDQQYFSHIVAVSFIG
jgi:hypothetical protein